MQALVFVEPKSLTFRADIDYDVSAHPAFEAHGGHFHRAVWTSHIKSKHFRDSISLQDYDSAMGILLFVVGLFILMGGVQMMAIGMLGLILIGAFVFSSMVIGKAVFRL